MLLNALIAGQIDLNSNQLQSKKGSVDMEEEKMNKVIEKGKELVDKDLEKVSGGHIVKILAMHWRCPKCGEINVAETITCKNCGADRP